MVRIKIFGERNTGTNYLENILELNLNVILLPSSAAEIPFLFKFEWYKNLFFLLTENQNLGWKHSRPNKEIVINHLKHDSQLLIFFLVKNPYSFLLSLHKRPYHNESKKGLKFQNFLSDKWETVSREKAIKAFDNPIEMWNDKVKSYLEILNLFPNQVQLIRYEDLIENPNKILELISTNFNVEFKQSEFVNYETSTKLDNKIFSDYAEYYIQERWKEKLTISDINFINKFLDKDIMNLLDYKYLP